MHEQPFTCENDLKELVRRLDSCELAAGEFGHAQHLAAGMWYLEAYGFDEALQRFGASLLRLLAHHGKTTGYNHTMTRFWLLRLEEIRRNTKTAGRPGSIGIHQLANRAIERLNRTELVFEHYTRETLFSDAAKDGWVEPDLPAKKTRDGARRGGRSAFPDKGVKEPARGVTGAVIDADGAGVGVGHGEG